MNNNFKHPFAEFIRFEDKKTDIKEPIFIPEKADSTDTTEFEGNAKVPKSNNPFSQLRPSSAPSKISSNATQGFVQKESPTPLSTISPAAATEPTNIVPEQKSEVNLTAEGSHIASARPWTENELGTNEALGKDSQLSNHLFDPLTTKPTFSGLSDQTLLSEPCFFPMKNSEPQSDLGPIFGEPSHAFQQKNTVRVNDQTPRDLSDDNTGTNATGGCVAVGSTSVVAPNNPFQSTDAECKVPFSNSSASSTQEPVFCPQMPAFGLNPAEVSAGSPAFEPNPVIQKTKNMEKVNPFSRLPATFPPADTPNVDSVPAQEPVFSPQMPVFGVVPSDSSNQGQSELQSVSSVQPDSKAQAPSPQVFLQNSASQPVFSLESQQAQPRLLTADNTQVMPQPLQTADIGKTSISAVIQTLPPQILQYLNNSGVTPELITKMLTQQSTAPVFSNTTQKTQKLNMSAELYKTMLEYEYFYHADSKTYYAKMSTDDGRPVFYDIAGDEYEGKILLHQEQKTFTSGTPNDLRHAKKKLKSYVVENAEPIGTLTRFAVVEGKIIWNLARQTGECIAITPDGYSLVGKPMLVKQEFGEIEPVEEVRLDCSGLEGTGKFFDLLGVTDNIERHFFTVLLVSYLFVGYDSPILYLFGENGRGKTTFAAALKFVFDPVRENQRGGLDLPERKVELALELSQQGVLHVDNFSSLAKPVQNTLCQAFSDGYFPIKKLYSNGQLMKIPLSCNIILISIELTKLRPDLTSRTVFHAMPQLATFMADTDFWDAYDNLVPMVRGELCWLASKVMRVVNKYKASGINR